MVHDAQHIRVLHSIAHVACAAEGNGEKRSAEGHTDFVAQRDEGILESVVSDTRLPLAILHAVGDDGIDGRIEPREEEPRQCREQIEHDGAAVGTEEVEPNHCDASKEGKDGSREALVARFSKYQREAGRTYDARHDDGHGIVGEERSRTFHVGEIVEHVGVAPVVDKAE